MVGVWLAMNGSIAATSASTKILTQAPFWGFFGDENPQGLDENPIRFQLLEEADAWDIWDEGTKRCNNFSSLESNLEAMKLRVEPMKLRVEPMKLRVDHAKSRLFSLW